MTLRIFTCTDHDGHYPVGVASVVIAADGDEARGLLDAELVKQGLRGHDAAPYTLQELPLNPQAVVLCNGDY